MMKKHVLKVEIKFLNCKITYFSCLYIVLKLWFNLVDQNKRNYLEKKNIISKKNIHK